MVNLLLQVILSDVASASTARTNLGLAIGSNVQAHNAKLDDIAGLAVTNGNFIVGDGANFVAETGSTARTSLGLGQLLLRLLTMFQYLVDQLLD
ncbi:MAG: hypothetical protein CM15mV128_100 [Caudoviricetes sp.]|nr:MAG: hypothetical protein CM15mV128_100 [Caudoviricetes sp.]